jgi:DNA-directed RNA polymerase subunit K/omega
MEKYMRDYPVNPVEVRMNASDDGSIYEALVAMGRRARQINDDIKTQLFHRMAHINPIDDDNEFGNFDQLTISKEFDAIPKPTFLSMKEYENNELDYELKSVEEKKTRKRSS